MATTAFVYGTLLFPEIVFALTKKHFTEKPAILRGYKRYKISDPQRRRYGPAIIPNKNGVVKGKVLFDIDEHSLNILTKWEREYVQMDVIVEVGKEKIKTFAYVGKKFKKRHLYKEWDEQEFKEKYLNLYLQKIIPEFLSHLK